MLCVVVLGNERNFDEIRAKIREAAGSGQSETATSGKDVQPSNVA